MAKIILPELSAGVTKATVSYWFYQEGETVQEKEDLVELTTDKATFNLPSPATGRVSSILIKEGQVVNVGDLLGEIQES